MAEEESIIRAYSCIGVVLQDYSNGTGDKTVRVTANLSPGFFPFVLSRMQNDLDRFDFTEDKIFGEPDEHGLSNLTSVDQYYGTQSKCCPHYVGVHVGDEVVCLTEGVMKSDLAYSFAQGSPYECGFVGLTGIPSYSQYERALEELDSIGVKRINVMVDSDYQVKEEVRKARDRYIEMGAAAGFEMAPITWTQKQKGVDDLYKHLFRDK